MNNVDEILNGVPEKSLQFKDTTSRKWKYDFIEFFIDKKLQNCLEIGAHRGYTTQILSHLFEHVWAIELSEKRIKDAIELNKNRNNITFIQDNVYVPSTYNTIPKAMDVIFIDCDHSYSGVMSDIKTAITMARPGRKVYIAFDDYGHSESIGVNQAVNVMMQYGLQFEQYIGENVGFTVDRTNGTSFSLIDREGIILSYKK